MNAALRIFVIPTAVVAGLVFDGSTKHKIAAYADTGTAPPTVYKPSLDLAPGVGCVGIDEFNSTARYLVQHYSFADGLRLRDLDYNKSAVLSAVIVLQQMNARSRTACRDLDAVWNHGSAELLRWAGMPH